MTAKQVQIRRGTATECDAATPPSGEIVYESTGKRLRMGDGSTGGGILQANFLDVQKSIPSYGVAGGSANAITVTLPTTPGSLGAGLRVLVKATANNSATATLAVNGLAATTINKLSGGSLVALSSGDIVNGAIHEYLHNGTVFILLNPNPVPPLTSISQGSLNTSTGTISLSITPASVPNILRSASVTLPGGQYGFFPQTKSSSVSNCINLGVTVGENATGTYTTNANLLAQITSGTASCSMDLQQRYVTSSPPFDLGDGDAGGFLFLHLDDVGNLVSHYLADVPPWAYNGPTNIRADRIDAKTGKKFRTVMRKRSLEEIMDGAEILLEEQEITTAIKNADMALIPHPFPDLPPGHKAVMIDPMDDRIAQLIAYQNAGGEDDVITAIRKGQIYADTDTMNRKGPSEVAVHGFRFKYTRNK